MCLIAFAYKAHPRYRLVLAANRDEFFQRPTLSLHEWQDHEGLLAGRDLEQMGTWLGITRSGRLAAITNYRNPAAIKSAAPSRGALVADFLTTNAAPEDYLSQIALKSNRYNGFNLLVGDRDVFYYYSNQNGLPREITSGIYGLSNHLLDTPWPKVEKARTVLTQVLASKRDTIDPEILLKLLQDQSRPSDRQLPETGVGLKKERMLSPLFITSPDYGTRCSSVILIDEHYFVTFVERTWQPAVNGPIALGTRRFSFIAS